VLASLSFGAIGTFLGALLPNARSAQALGLILFFVMMLISGAGPPREVLDATIRDFGEILPLTHAIIVLQDPWLGLGWATTASTVVVGFFVVCLTLTAVLFRWE
jgi:ABC-2 type transport system permease protein